MTKEVSGKIIGFDMDGVIVDNAPNKIRIAKTFGYDLKLEETASDFIDSIIPEGVMDQIRPLLYDDPVISMEAGLIDGAKEGLEAIKNSGKQYFLISRRHNHQRAVQLLEKLGIWPTYFNKKNAFFVFEPEEKNAKAIELGIDRYVDDEPSVLAKLTSVPERFLFDRFSKFGELPFAHKKVSSWKELLTHFI